MSRKVFLRSILIILISIVAGFLLISAVYCIPVSMMEMEAMRSAELLKVEGDYPFDPISVRSLDNYTDSLMLNLAVYPGDENPVQKALGAYYFDVPGQPKSEIFADIYAGDSGEYEKASYERYWHGYLLSLKPLLVFFDYGQIRQINRIVQYALLTALFLLIYRKERSALFPFAIFIALLAPSTIWRSLQYSTVFYISVISSFLLLWNPRGLLRGDRLIYFFLITGIVTAFMDFLTYPTAALTVPLVFLCLREREEKAASTLKLALGCVLAWFMGYGGMWAGKWLLVFAGGGMESLENVLAAIELRASATNGHSTDISRLGTLAKCFSDSFNGNSLLLISCIFSGLSLISMAANYKRLSFAAAKKLCLPLLLPVLVSLGWILLMSNHVYVHIFFTYRNLAPAIFAVLVCVSTLADLSFPDPR